MKKPAERVFKGALIGFTLGLALAVGAASWLWLEMRVNVGLLIPVATILCAMFSLSKKGAFSSYRDFIIAQILLVGTLLAFYGPDWGALWSMPAYLFREGFLCPRLTREVAALIVGGILLGGNLLWIAFKRKNNF